MRIGVVSYRMFICRVMFLLHYEGYKSECDELCPTDFPSQRVVI